MLCRCNFASGKQCDTVQLRRFETGWKLDFEGKLVLGGFDDRIGNGDPFRQTGQRDCDIAFHPCTSLSFTIQFDRLGGFGGAGLVVFPWDTGLLVILALGCFTYAQRCRLGNEKAALYRERYASELPADLTPL